MSPRRGRVTRPQGWNRTSRVCVLAALTATLALTVMVLHTQQFLFGDGAFFAFTATLSDPWHANWRDYPGRLAMFVTTVAPAHVAYQLGLPFRLVPALCALLFLLHPLVCIRCAFPMLPEDKKDWILLAVLYWACVGMCTFSFPTETFIGASAFWPALLGSLHPRPRPWHVILRSGAAALLCLSHESALLTVPVILLAVLWDGTRIVPPLRVPPGERVFLSVVACAAMVGLYSATAFHPANPQVAGALKGNLSKAFDLMIFHRYPLLKAGTIVVLLASASFFVRDESAALLLLAPVASAVTFAMEKVMVHPGLAPQRLYLARTGILYTLPLFGMGVLWAARTGRCLHRRVVVPTIVFMMSAQVVHHVFLNRDWRTYRDAFMAELLIPTRAGLVDYETTSLPSLVRSQPRLKGFLWPWVMPYQSMFLGAWARHRLTHLLYNPESGYVHLRCETARQLSASPPREIPKELIVALADHICQHNP